MDERAAKEAGCWNVAVCRDKASAVQRVVPRAEGVNNELTMIKQEKEELVTRLVTSDWRKQCRVVQSNSGQVFCSDERVRKQKIRAS